LTEMQLSSSTGSSGISSVAELSSSIKHRVLHWHRTHEQQWLNSAVRNHSVTAVAFAASILASSFRLLLMTARRQHACRLTCRLHNWLQCFAGVQRACACAAHHQHARGTHAAAELPAASGGCASSVCLGAYSPRSSYPLPVLPSWKSLQAVMNQLCGCLEHVPGN
jgi:hypothetical protein